MTATLLNLVLSMFLNGSAAHAQAPNSTQNPAQNPPANSAMDYWRVSARKNFLEGFCVGQSLAAQQIVVQPGQLITQTTINSLKAAIQTCKGQMGGSPSPSPTPTN